MQHERSRLIRIISEELGRSPRKIIVGYAHWRARYRKPQLPPDDVRQDIGLAPLPKKFPDWWQRW